MKRLHEFHSIQFSCGQHFKFSKVGYKVKECVTQGYIYIFFYVWLASLFKPCSRALELGYIFVQRRSGLVFGVLFVDGVSVLYGEILSLYGLVQTGLNVVAHKTEIYRFV